METYAGDYISIIKRKLHFSDVIIVAPLGSAENIMVEYEKIKHRIIEYGTRNAVKSTKEFQDFLVCGKQNRFAG